MRSQEATNLVKHAVRVAQDQMIGETENDKTSSCKPSIPAAVARGPGEVRGTIGFDDETRLLAEEIDNKWSDGMLASKFGVHDICQSICSAGVERRCRARAMQVEGLGNRGMHAYRRQGTDGCFSTMLPAPLSVPERGWG